MKKQTITNDKAISEILNRKCFMDKEALRQSQILYKVVLAGDL